MEAYEEEKEDVLNNSLTNLQWLQHINMNLSEGLSLPRKTVASSSFNVPTTIPDHKEERQRGVDYAHNSLVKPPYSYATLICMAIRATSKHKITLSAIYNWIMRNFAYYRNADPSWQNSIRHNLSLNKCFLKVPRDKDEPGKGGFWMINPEYEDYFKNGVFKRRKPEKSKKNNKTPYARGLYRSNMFSTNGKQGCSKSSPSNSTASSTPRSTPINTPLTTPHSTPPRLEFFEEAQQNQLMFNHSSPIRPLHQSHQQSTPVRKICTKALVNQNNNISLNLNNNNHNNTNNNANNNANNNNNNNNNVVVDEQPWDLVLRDIQLNTGAFEQCVQQDDDFFNTDLNLGNDLLGGGSTLSGDLSDLVRDIENLIDVPGLGQPDLVVKGVGSQNWGGIMDELNFGDYMDSPLSSLVG